MVALNFHAIKFLYPATTTLVVAGYFLLKSYRGDINA